MSLASDGASVKTGQRNGLAAKLKSMKSKIISFHYICHRLALSCVDSNDERSYVSVVETILRQLKFFEIIIPRKRPPSTSRFNLPTSLSLKWLVQPRRLCFKKCAHRAEPNGCLWSTKLKSLPRLCAPYADTTAFFRGRCCCCWLVI